LLSGNGSRSYFVAALGLPEFCWLQCFCYRLIELFFFLIPTFFLLAGCLASLKIAKEKEKRKEKKKRFGSSQLSLIGIAFSFGKQVALYSLGIKEERNIKQWTG